MPLKEPGGEWAKVGINSQHPTFGKALRKNTRHDFLLIIYPFSEGVLIKPTKVDRERTDHAKAGWKQGRMILPQSDNHEFISLPGDRSRPSPQLLA